MKKTFFLLSLLALITFVGCDSVENTSEEDTDPEILRFYIGQENGTGFDCESGSLTTDPLWTCTTDAENNTVKTKTANILSVIDDSTTSLGKSTIMPLPYYISRIDLANHNTDLFMTPRLPAGVLATKSYNFNYGGFSLADGDHNQKSFSELRIDDDDEMVFYGTSWRSQDQQALGLNLPAGWTASLEETSGSKTTECGQAKLQTLVLNSGNGTVRLKSDESGSIAGYTISVQTAKLYDTNSFGLACSDLGATEVSFTLIKQ